MTSGELFSPIFAPDELIAATGADAVVAALLAFEGALARAEAECGVIPSAAADAIAAAADRLAPDPAALAERARASGNPVVPLVRLLADAAGDAGAYVHFGATSQDAFDTAVMLVARDAGRLVSGALSAAAAAARRLALEHGETLLAARTLLQQALPMTFALKAAGWAVALEESRAGLVRVLETRLALQFGGAAGTLASLGTAGPAVAGALARRLGLVAPRLAWHTDRTRIAELAGALATAAGAAGKVALDVTLLAQSEVGEVAEAAGAGRGGSSTLPHKANPIRAVRARAAALQAPGLAANLFAAMAQEHERAAGAWHAEWETLGALWRAAGGAAANVAASLAGLVVNAPAMAANLERLHGVLLAEKVALDLAPDLGRERAHALVEEAARRALAEHTSLRAALGASAEITARRSGSELDRLCDPADYLGASATLVARALESAPGDAGDGAEAERSRP